MSIRDEMLAVFSKRKSETEGRNQRVFLAYFGFSEEVCPTLDNLGEKYISKPQKEGERKAEVARQVVERKVNALIRAKHQLPSLDKCAAIIFERKFYDAEELSRKLVENGLIETSIGLNMKRLLLLIEKLGYGKHYDLYYSDLKPATKTKYTPETKTFVIDTTAIEDLDLALEAASDLSREMGVAAKSYLLETLGEGYRYKNEVLSLLQANDKVLWFDDDGGETYYHFCRKSDSMLNFLGKAFNIAPTLPFDDLYLAFDRTFRRGTKKPNWEMPPEPIVKAFIRAYTKSKGDRITYRGRLEELTHAEQKARKYLEAHGVASKKQLSCYLKDNGCDELTIIHTVYYSPILVSDESSRHKHYRFYLVGSDRLADNGEEDDDLLTWDEDVELDPNLLAEMAELEDLGLRELGESESRMRDGRAISRSDLHKALQSATNTGELGEQIVAGYLQYAVDEKAIQSFIWEAYTNAVAPFDFKLVKHDGSEIFVDVKSTRGRFENVLHISYSELCKMRDSEKYFIYRVYDLEEGGAMMRISENMHAFAERILRYFDLLPSGVRPDGVSLIPAKLRFGDPVEVEVDELQVSF